MVIAKLVVGDGTLIGGGGLGVPVDSITSLAGGSSLQGMSLTSASCIFTSVGSLSCLLSK